MPNGIGLRVRVLTRNQREHVGVIRGADARDVIDAALAEVLEVDEVDESAQIAQVAAKKLRTLRSLDAATARRRLYAFLARRGYDGSAIRRVMDALPASGDSEASTLE